MAMKIGYTLSSEEFGPLDLVRHARLAEECEFDFLMVSDHYHPWVDQQGHSPFVWAVIGGVSQVTERLPLGTAVTCPTVRIHPAVIAQAAATAACMLPGRFFLGVGSGEMLNEHILGDHWPNPAIRLEMLEEAIAVIRELWQGGVQSFAGDYYTVDQARVYTLPDGPPPILVAAGGAQAARLAGSIGDGLIATTADADLVKEFQAQRNGNGPRYGQITVCWDESEAEARRIARQWWPNAAVPGPLMSELKLPEHYEAVVSLITEDDVAEAVVCGPDPQRHLAKIAEYARAGFDHVYVHQVGPKQEEAIRFYQREVLPAARGAMPEAA